ncbi:MAG: TIGR03960 family B12-binding radical SAM protein [Spirochaetes bacterium]|nr:TIGR03960 family B12-binding radical SAM protein [Spirochaetota bacterium]
MNNLNEDTVNRLVFNLQKPGRYIGRELNQIKKSNPFIRMAVCYPDLYEVGMSNNGIRILYDIANRISDVGCERVFAVSDDFEAKIRAMKIPLYTLESYTPLCELDLLGFNLAYELLHTNVLQVLDLGQIPLFSKDRGEEHPIVIAGGEAVSNPLPVQDFFDAIFIGDGEEGIIDILNAVRTAKLDSLGRKDTLELFSRIEGMYVPLLSSQKEFAVKKRFVKAESLYNPLRPVMPSLRITQERLVVEVTRGCKNLCNYCHSGYYELPYRYAKPGIITDQILKLINNAYYSDLTLSSLSISDFKYLIPLLNSILPVLIDKAISISLPSLRVDKRTLPIIEQISDIRKASLTFAVESACEEIRSIANKKLRTEDILSIAEYVFSHGWNLLKLYFMIGLPGCEEYDEAGAMIDLLKKIHFTGGKKRDLNVTISPYIPKPHTPFQYEKQMSSAYFSDVILKVKRGLPRQVAIKAHDINASLLEGIMARGDSELNKVIYNSYMDGARLDSWREHFKFEVWKNNLDKIPGWQKYLNARDKNEALPWSFIKTGFDRISELQRERISPTGKETAEKKPYEELNTTAITESFGRFKRKYEVKRRIRIKFTKTGMAKYISHLDFIQIIIRALGMIEAPVAYTQGFNKRERIAMGFPLPVGIESVYELCDVDLFEDVDISSLPAELCIKLPEGITAANAVYLEEKKSLMSITFAALFEIDINDNLLYKNSIKNLELKADFTKETAKGKRSIGFDEAVLEYNIQNNNSSSEKSKILLKLRVGSDNSMRIDNTALALAQAGYDEFYKFRITRMRQYKTENGNFKEIM